MACLMVWFHFIILRFPTKRTYSRMLEMISSLGRSGLSWCEGLGRAGIFLARTLIRRPRVMQGLALTIEQIYSVGVLSLLIIIVSALFIGMVVGLQGYNTLIKFG